MIEHILRGFVGIIVILGIGFLFSRNRKAISWRIVLSGIGLQIVLAVLLTQVGFIRTAFGWVSEGFVTVIGFSSQGASFVFGDLVNRPEGSGLFPIFAFKVLPTIIFVSALTSVLYYVGALQLVVKAFAWVFSKIMKLSGSESISVAGNVFLGQTEAPLLVKPYVEKMTKSELMLLMTGGMATIAGSVLGAFVDMLGGTDPASRIEFANHLLTASLMNAPAAIVMAKMLIPETEHELINHDLNVSNEKIGANLIDALSNGTSEGLKLALNVGAMLIAFVAMIYGINFFLGDVVGGIAWNEETFVGKHLFTFEGLNYWINKSTAGSFDKLSLQYLVGQVFRFLAFAIGIEWKDSLKVGSLLGTKVIVNEFIAYDNLGKFEPGAISYRSKVMATYALCGFANFSSIGIQIGGIGGIAPKKRADISRLGLLAVVGGTMATLLTAAVAGMFVPEVPPQ